MRWAFALCAALLLASAARAADAPITGRVFDTARGVETGIHFALVELHTPGAGGGVSTATTGVDGSFAITLPPRELDDVFVMVSAQGYYPYHQWWSAAELQAASPLLIGLDPAPQRVPVTIFGAVYNAAVGPSAPIDNAEISYTYHSYQDAFPEMSGTLRTGVDGRYEIEQLLGDGDYVEVNVAAAGFADSRQYFNLAGIVEGQPYDFALAPLGGAVRIDPASVHLTCSAVFPVTITNVSATETLVILDLSLSFHYGEGVYGRAFTPDLSQVQFPVLLGPGEHFSFPMAFSASVGPSHDFPTLLGLGVISGARESNLVQYYGGFAPCETVCSGDCDGSGLITVDEIVRAVVIALGDADVSACATIDADGNAQVSIDELVSAVDAALAGCGL